MTPNDIVSQRNQFTAENTYNQYQLAQQSINTTTSQSTSTSNPQGLGQKPFNGSPSPPNSNMTGNNPNNVAQLPRYVPNANTIGSIGSLGSLGSMGSTTFGGKPNSLAVPQASFHAATAVAGGEQFVIWQMQSRKLRHMKHEELLDWLQKNKFDKETVNHFKERKIDGRILWNNIRNASMFLYNVGVVRPTLRDAIVQNIYLNLMPKTPGFDERFIKDFKNLKLIANGPISTVYEALYKKGNLKLRDSRLVIKGYHYKSDDIRVGKIIQILTHITAKITKIETPSRFVSIYGFIRDMNVSAAARKNSQATKPPNLSGNNNFNQPNMAHISEERDDSKDSDDINLNNPNGLGGQARVKFSENLEDRTMNIEADGTVVEYREPVTDENAVMNKNVKDENKEVNLEQTDSIFGIVMEFADVYSLRTQFKRGYDFNLIEKLGILLEVAEAMSELHDASLLHKNLKASNILISGDDVKLTDYCFDITQIGDFTQLSKSIDERSLRWMSPELVTFQQYSKKSDVYAFGITMYEVLTQNVPYYEYENITELIPKV